MTQFNLDKLEVSYYGYGHDNEIESAFTYDGVKYFVNCYYSNTDGWDFLWRNPDDMNKYVDEPNWFTNAMERDEFQPYEFAEIYLNNKEEANA